MTMDSLDADVMVLKTSTVPEVKGKENVDDQNDTIDTKMKEQMGQEDDTAYDTDMPESKEANLGDGSRKPDPYEAEEKREDDELLPEKVEGPKCDI